MSDEEIVAAFTNFLSWGERPSKLGPLDPHCVLEHDLRRRVPPAWWAYGLGATPWCPPKGEL